MWMSKSLDLPGWLCGEKAFWLILEVLSDIDLHRAPGISKTLEEILEVHKLFFAFPGDSTSSYLIHTEVDLKPPTNKSSEDVSVELQVDSFQP